MNNSIFTCMQCDKEMQVNQFGGVVVAIHKSWNDAAIFILCRNCYKKQNRLTANVLLERLKLIQNTKLQQRCAVTTLNIIALNNGSLIQALEYGHDCPNLLAFIARSDVIIFPPWQGEIR